MTTLLTTQDVARITQTLGLPEVFKRMVGYLEADYLRWNEFDKCARVASHTDDGVIELMPIADASLYSFKYVNGHPKNTRLGLPTVMAVGLLAEVATGRPELLSELTLTTAIRTAATSAMVARKLARKDAKSMALIGNGAQSEFQALAFHYLLGISEIRMFDIDPAASAKLLRHLQGLPGLTLKVCASTAEAVRGADIITTVTADKTNATIITPEMIEAGMHINGVGGDCPGKTEMHRGVLEAAKVFVEFEPQSRIEGDLQQMPAEFAVTEFWCVLKGISSGRDSAEQITFFDSVGFALEDFSALRLLRDCARELGLGQDVSLIPTMADPKNLFGQLGLGQTASTLQAA
ncbi:ornithine cyclodeaminase [Paucibacter sp. B2R-40]|uniref:ornithine cyclodeaminase n=1 Tax=Paucibacter sp. B2R-40 TaxID=2893554 RepID=UPI0021E4C5A3|nr:ornithine cyclodeaminase [Paucibacter sp. B2R-40]MCV2355231.1 ornithine cyclodeaminase [Paucibacter sp. B2R-40]